LAVIDNALFEKIAAQLMAADRVEVEGAVLPVRRTSSQRLKTVAFTSGGQKYQAIEQNPDKPSRWGQLARSGHQVVQFKDVAGNRFVAVSVDCKLTVYGGRAGRAAGQ
jgi:hypothetical protein